MVTSCVILLVTCCFCCFCCCACFCDCFCGCCCNRCCKSKYDDGDEDGYMEYDPEAAHAPPPPKSKIASIINTLSSKRVIKKKKKNTPSAEEASGIPMTENTGQPTSIRVDPRSTPSKLQSNKSKKIYTRSTQEGSNEENVFNVV
uniref:Secreted protein n=1 Tax=Panagrolaimus superbus TaxID=310955 RepID=A0A914YEK4_9BILA